LETFFVVVAAVAGSAWRWTTQQNETEAGSFASVVSTCLRILSADSSGFSDRGDSMNEPDLAIFLASLGLGGT
jgi:hypothetical protein